MSCEQALKSFDYVLWGSKGKIAWRRKMQTKLQLKWCTQNVHPSFADFRPRLGVNFHILWTQNWLWESSLSLLSLWCILFRIKLGLFRENLNLKKNLRSRAPFGTGSYESVTCLNAKNKKKKTFKWHKCTIVIQQIVNALSKRKKKFFKKVYFSFFFYVKKNHK